MATSVAVRGIDARFLKDGPDGTIIVEIGGVAVLTLTASALTGSALALTVATIVGALTGNVTGNVTGNLTGNVTGNVTGNLTGNVTGNVTGAQAGATSPTTFTPSAATELTIATGAVTVTQMVHTIDTENDDASDELDTLTGGTAGRSWLLLYPAADARSVVIRDTGGGTGNIRTPSAQSITLAEDDDYALLHRGATNWTVVAFKTLANGGGGLGAALASTSANLGAALVGIEDSGNNFAATTVEAALAEIISDLAATTATNGASRIGVEDSASTITGTTVETALAELSNRIRTQLVTCTLSAAAEDANVIAVTINVVDLNGTAVSRVQRLECRLYEATMIEAVAAAFTMAETGAGSAVSTTANAALIIDTDANGDAIVSVTDVATGSSKTMHLIVTPIGPSGTYAHGTPAHVAITFDGA